MKVNSPVLNMQIALWKSLKMSKKRIQFSSVAQSWSDSLRPHGPQHARRPCPSPTPGVYPNSCPLPWKFLIAFVDTVWGEGGGEAWRQQRSSLKTNICLVIILESRRHCYIVRRTSVTSILFEPFRSISSNFCSSHTEMLGYADKFV